MAQDKLYDVFVIGGGINGCGIARDAIGRGYSVFLAEMNDLASGTSSWSSKLIHGGFRYLEYYEFRLVREALSEREVLLSNAPHIIWPMRFVLPHHKDMRPAWLLRLGLFLYDHIGTRKLLPGTTTVNLKTSPVGKPLKPLFSKGFEYSDCWVNDARLVVLNARDAADRGAEIRTRTEVVSAERKDGVWEIEVTDRASGVRETVRARLIVNAGGPWVDRILSGVVGRKDAHNVRLVQGSHIVVPKLHDHDRAYIFQNGDGRIIFALPYEEDFTLIGTTDQDYTGDPKDVVITDPEIDYLCAAASEYFAKPVQRDSIVWTYSGVRPLYDDGASAAQEATRDYVLKPDTAEGAPLLNIFGGKITTYRKLAESMLELIEARLGKKAAPWTHRAALPGGDFPADGFDAQVARLLADYPFLDPKQARRYFRQYGTKARVLLGGCSSREALGQHFGYGLYALEVDYLIAQEWAREAADVIWRRSKRGLRLDKDQVAALDAYMTGKRAV
ncbi:glycerol-3-phosphate dehydrogenase [Hoeflea sp. YIM 152468]|uniref:glycerol-3-phosphate dehydrogenase n=1 Tax=Hoeflea sp. YIM 152468 TaxID=3031759 RepID=UPI0023DC51A7|nr:glycerol-3-phosphate dehydrogenase [Hoeflea sp. YIM 152468]MDF1607661.1 glycerol-3-phosphate dehydrogenase [Hoeflea sp. YIM 152468]